MRCVSRLFFSCSSLHHHVSLCDKNEMENAYRILFSLKKPVSELSCCSFTQYPLITLSASSLNRKKCV